VESRVLHVFLSTYMVASMLWCSGAQLGTSWERTIIALFVRVFESQEAEATPVKLAATPLKPFVFIFSDMQRLNQNSRTVQLLYLNSALVWAAILA
jgi:hypothetical protein